MKDCLKNYLLDVFTLEFDLWFNYCARCIFAHRHCFRSEAIHACTGRLRTSQ